MPAEFPAQINAGRHADDRRDRERRHQDSGGAASSLLREHVGDDRQGKAAQNAAETAGNHSGGEQHQESLRQATE